MTREAAARPSWKRLLIFPFGLVSLVLALTLWGVASMRSSERALDEGSAARGAWEERHAKEEANDAAARLAEACAPMGLDVAPRDAATPARATPPETERALRSISHLFVQARVGGFKRRQPLPANIDAFLTTHAGPVDDASRVLLEGVPRWSFDPDPLAASSIPAHARGLEELLLAAAFQAVLLGDRSRSDELMLAAWRLEDAVERHPRAWGWWPPLSDRTEQLVMLRLVRPADAKRWIERLDALDLRETVADAMYASARSTLAQQVAPSQDPEAQRLPRALQAIGDSIARVRTGHDVRTYLEWEAELRALEPCERAVLGARRVGKEHPLLRLTRGDGVFAAWPLLVLDDTEIEMALTRRVLARAAGLEPTPSPAGACRDDLIVEERHPDGSLEIRWSGELAPGNGSRPRVFTLAAGDIAPGAPP